MADFLQWPKSDEPARAHRTIQNDGTAVKCGSISRLVVTLGNVCVYAAQDLIPFNLAAPAEKQKRKNKPVLDRLCIKQQMDWFFLFV